MAFNRVFPHTDGAILRPRHNSVPTRTYSDRADWTLVSSETEGSNIWFKVPYHHGAVTRARNHLFEIWVEACCENVVLVSFETSLECWISQIDGISSNSLLNFSLFGGSIVSLHLN